MKIAEVNQNLRLEGNFETYNFRLKASASAFQILTSKLYSNIPNAIVRELSTNAVDSHIVAGTTNKPYEVHLPSNNEAYFSIRDYGTGLTPEAVKNVFTVIFESNKTNSNLLNGALGLGSKSPFAISDQYNVESFVNGKYYLYTCYKDDKGVPSVACISEEETEELNGLRITVPVRSKDCESFKVAARQIYPYFNLKPKFVNQNVTIAINDIQYNIKDGEWGWTSTYSRPNGVNGIMVIMGNVAYSVSSKIPRTGLSQLEMAVLDSNIDLFCEIGDVDIEAGRENIQYSTRTLNVLKNKITQIVSYISNDIQKQFNNCKTPWEAWAKVRDIKNSFSSIVSSHVLNSVQVSVNGQQIPLNKTTVGFPYNKFQEVYTFTTTYRTNKLKKSRTSHLYPDMKTKFILDDGCKAAYARVRYLVGNNVADMQHYVFCKFATQQLKDEFIEMCGIDNSFFILASSLPKKPRTISTVPGQPKKKTAAACVYHPGSALVDCWTDTQVDLNAGGYYVEIDRYRCPHNGKELHPSTINSVLTCLCGMKIKGFIDPAGLSIIPCVVGMRKTLANKVKGMSGWINLFDFFLAEFDKFDKKFDLGQKLANIESFHKENYDVPCFETLYEYYDKYDTTTLMHSYFEKVKSVDCKDDERLINILQEMLPLFGKNIQKKQILDLTNLREQVIIKYPFAGLVRYLYDDSLQAHIVDYVNSLG